MQSSRVSNTIPFQSDLKTPFACYATNCDVGQWFLHWSRHAKVEKQLRSRSNKNVAYVCVCVCGHEVPLSQRHVNIFRPTQNQFASIYRCTASCLCFASYSTPLFQSSACGRFTQSDQRCTESGLNVLGVIYNCGVLGQMLNPAELSKMQIEQQEHSDNNQI